MLAYEPTVLETETIVDACLDRYRAAGLSARPVAWSRLALDEAADDQASVIVSNECLDWVLTPLGDPAAHRPVFRRLAADGWQVHVLVPLERMGEAHRGLRGVAVRLQGWWLDDGSVHFGRPEIP
ncbi:MAG: hypothetical protein WAM81_03690 [Acidimicrobiia bacterium]